MRIVPMNSQASSGQQVFLGMQAVSHAELVVVCPRYEDNEFLGFSFTYESACVQAYLKKHGIVTSHYLCSRSQRLESHADEIVHLQPAAVSFVLFDSNYYLCFLVAKLVKDLRPEIVTIGTGPAATLSYQLILNRPGSPFDLLIRGNAEGALKNLLTSRPALEEVATGLEPKTGDRILTADDLPSLDAIPSPYSDGTIAARVPLIGRVGTLVSRGCARSCTYCEHASHGRTNVQFRSADHVVEELRFLVQATRKERASSKLFLPFLDRCFTTDRQRTLALLDRIISEGLNREIQFSCQTRADAVDLELLQSLQLSGCSALNLELESAIPRVLNTVKRNRTTDGAQDNYCEEQRALAIARENVRMANDFGIPTCVTITLGLPSEKAEEGSATLAFVNDSDCRSYAHNFFRAVEGSEAFGSCARFGIVVRPCASGLPYLTTPAYDVLSLPFSSRKPLANISSRRTSQLNDHLRGFSTCYKPEDHTLPHFLYLHGAPADFKDEVLCDLCRHVAPDARLYLVEPADDATIAAFYRRMVSHHFPLACVYGLSQNGTNSRLAPFDRGERTPASVVFSTQLESVRFQQYPHLRLICQARNSHDWIGLLTIESPDDFETLDTVCREAEAEGCLNIPSEILPHKYALKESCRWGCRQCRDYFRRGVHAVHVSSQGHVRLCEHGPVVGALKEQPAAWQDRMESFASELERERGCASCPATDRCAHCMVPRPCSAEQYCTFHLNNPHAGELTNLLLIKQALSQNGEKHTREGSTAQDMKLALPDCGCPVYFHPSPNAPASVGCPNRELPKRVRIRDGKRLIALQDMAYIADLHTLDVIEISTPLAEIWEALQAGAPLDAMLQFFTAKYSLSPEQVVTKLEQALGIFEEYGILV